MTNREQEAATRCGKPHPHYSFMSCYRAPGHWTAHSYGVPAHRPTEPPSVAANVDCTEHGCVSHRPTEPDEDGAEPIYDAIWDALEPRLEDVIDLDLNEPADSAVFRILVGQVRDAVLRALPGAVPDEDKPVTPIGEKP